MDSGKRWFASSKTKTLIQTKNATSGVRAMMEKTSADEFVVRRGPDKAPRMPKAVSGTTKVEMSDLEKSQRSLAMEVIDLSVLGRGFLVTY